MELKPLFAVLVAASLTPVPAPAQSLEAQSAEAGSKFDFTVKAPGSPAVAVGSASEGQALATPPAYAALLSQAGLTHAAPPSPKHQPRQGPGFWAAIGGAARETAAAGVALAVALVPAAAGLLYAGTIIGPLFVAGLMEDYERRSFGERFADHMVSPVTWGAGAFKRARATVLKALT